MADSTNAERPGFTPSERTLERTFDTIFSEHRDTRIIIATFASNVDRVQTIINAAYKFDRKVAVEGRSMVSIMDIASDLNRLSIPENTLVNIDEIKNYPPEKTVLITTGSQGESMAALSRMANGTHRKISVGAGDTVIFSSNPIPGNEKAVTKIINELLFKGADVIFQDAHVSGHACQEELKLIYSLVHPKYSIPVHGEYKHLKAQAKLAAELGVPKDNIFILRSGDILSLNEESAKIVGKAPAGGLYVDGLGVGDIGNSVIRDRQHLSEDGIVVAVMVVDEYSGSLIAGPELFTRGVVYVKESEEILDEATRILTKDVSAAYDRGITDWGKIKNVCRDSLNDFFWKKYTRRPLLLPIIIDV